jgi:hypothetical protein
VKTRDVPGDSFHDSKCKSWNTFVGCVAIDGKSDAGVLDASTAVKIYGAIEESVVDNDDSIGVDDLSMSGETDVGVSNHSDGEDGTMNTDFGKLSPLPSLLAVSLSAPSAPAPSPPTPSQSELAFPVGHSILIVLCSCSQMSHGTGLHTCVFLECRWTYKV